MDWDEPTKYKKKSAKKHFKKSKHKHDYQPCVLEYRVLAFSKEKGFYPGPVEPHMGACCTICGKIGVPDQTWWEWVPLGDGAVAGHSEPSQKAKRQLNPATRTLRTYYLEDWLQKYVSFDGGDHQ